MQISVRALRQKWPEAERALKTESEIVVTRDYKPVAKLTRYEDRPKKRRRFDPTRHGQLAAQASCGKGCKLGRRISDRRTFPGLKGRSISGKN
jgi:antitoxin (DNA-binding transcriptional repressor) of toxin-antitoxin stability system